MPIEQISSTSSLFSPSTSGGGGSGGGAFLAALQKANDETGAGIHGVASGSAGSPNLNLNWWPERFDAGLENAADKLDVSVDEMKERFAEIVSKAEAEGGFSSPVEFLKSLPDEDLDFLSMVQGLADPIDRRALDTYSPEAALNFMLPQGVQGDWNNDVIYSVGGGNSFRFPTNNTPQHVQDAWAEMTADMTMEEKMLAEGKFMISIMTANIKYDVNGKPVGSYMPGEEGWTNPFANIDYDYRQHAQERLDWNEHIRGQISSEQYERDKEFWSDFITALDKHQPKSLSA